MNGLARPRNHHSEILQTRRGLGVRGWTFSGLLALAWIALLGAEARALLTIDQAVELSQKTGRPIFAVAGSKT